MYLLAAASAKHIDMWILMSHLATVLRVADRLKAEKSGPMTIAVMYDKLVRCCVGSVMRAIVRDPFRCRKHWEHKSTSKFPGWELEKVCGKIDSELLKKAIADHEKEVSCRVILGQMCPLVL